MAERVTMSAKALLADSNPATRRVPASIGGGDRSWQGLEFLEGSAPCE